MGVIPWTRWEREEALRPGQRPLRERQSGAVGGLVTHEGRMDQLSAWHEARVSQAARDDLGRPTGGQALADVKSGVAGKDVAELAAGQAILLARALGTQLTKVWAM